MSSFGMTTKLNCSVFDKTLSHLTGIRNFPNKITSPCLRCVTKRKDRKKFSQSRKAASSEKDNNNSAGSSSSNSSSRASKSPPESPVRNLTAPPFGTRSSSESSPGASPRKVH
ncbi:uncharacterized protein LOC119767984 [Culex quinquefasciatus]|uniref:uncharacterized protein LOC119767984 n=1 Tax=Culex quinquefasciatus TaxID=7176 RepID=UPI0018E3CADB|nr:uncharacterized protein LOC119767984 [Culex quinquefasciatus]